MEHILPSLIVGQVLCANFTWECRRNIKRKNAFQTNKKYIVIIVKVIVNNCKKCIVIISNF